MSSRLECRLVHFPPLVRVKILRMRTQVFFPNDTNTMSSVVAGRGVPEAVRLSLLRGKAWVSGRWVEAVSGKTFPVLNPANGEIIAEVSE